MTEVHVMRLMENIPEDRAVSVHQLTCKSGLNNRTIKKCLQLIIDIQGARKVVKEQVGLRFLVKKEGKGTPIGGGNYI